MKTFTRLISTAVLSLALTGMAQAQSLTVYSAGPGGLAKELAIGFQAKTGIKVNLFQATTGKVMARLAAEQANPVADVVISASWATATQYDGEGLLLPYTSPNAAKVPDFLKTGTYVAEGISALSIAWNTKSGTPEPKDWADLADPAYKNLVTMPDPASSGSAYALVAAITSNKDLGWGLFDKLKANGMIVPGANAQALNPVLQGAKAAVFGAVDYKVFNEINKGESLKVIFPASGTVVAPRPMMILKSSKNQDAAKKFIDYVLSKEGQASVAKTNLMPARTDVGAKRPLISDLKLLSVDPATDREAVLKKFAGIFAGS